MVKQIRPMLTQSSVEALKGEPDIKLVVENLNDELPTPMHRALLAFVAPTWTGGMAKVPPGGTFKITSDLEKGTGGPEHGVTVVQYALRWMYKFHVLAHGQQFCDWRKHARSNELDRCILMYIFAWRHGIAELQERVMIHGICQFIRRQDVEQPLNPLLPSPTVVARAFELLYDPDASEKPSWRRDPLIKFLTDYYLYLIADDSLPEPTIHQKAPDRHILKKIKMKFNPYKSKNAKRVSLDVRPRPLNVHVYHTEWTLVQVEGELDSYKPLEERIQACPDCYGDPKGRHATRWRPKTAERKAWRAQYFKDMQRDSNTIQRQSRRADTEEYSTTSGAEDTGPRRPGPGLRPETAGHRFHASRSSRSSSRSSSASSSEAEEEEEDDDDEEALGAPPGKQRRI
jgi:hypothetical protein